ncbi:MAG: hypothetical protein KAJ51_05840, partial [Thermoplasmata archaeon]|nr:hypothetical protein [Thermoplasmata archaeon]
LHPGNSTSQQALFYLSKNAPDSEFNITIIATSFYGGKTVNDSKVIHIEIEPHGGPELNSGKKLNLVLLSIWLIIILVIIIGIIIAAMLRKRKQKQKAELAAQELARAGAGVSLLPDVISAQGTVPQLGGAVRSGPAGQLGTATPILTPSVGTTLTPSQTPQIAQPETRPQLPPAQLGMEPPLEPQSDTATKLSLDEKLRLLEERFLKGEIDQITFVELRDKYATLKNAQQFQAQPRLPPAPSNLDTSTEPSPEQQSPSPPDNDLSKADEDSIKRGETT